MVSTKAAQLPAAPSKAPELPDLINVLEGFVSAEPEDGARGMALVASAFRAAGLQADLAPPNDPRRIDVRIKRDGSLWIASEVKQDITREAVADTLARDAASQGFRTALLAVLRPGSLVDFDRTGVVRRAETQRGVVVRVTDGVRELLHEALLSGTSAVDAFCIGLPRAFAEAMAEVEVAKSSLDTWRAIAQRW